MVDGLMKTAEYFREELAHNRLRTGQMIYAGVDMAPPKSAIEHFVVGQN